MNSETENKVLKFLKDEKITKYEILVQKLTKSLSKPKPILGELQPERESSWGPEVWPGPDTRSIIILYTVSEY